MAALKGFFRRFREKTGSSLAVVILAALLLEGFAILENYYARTLLQRELERRTESQIRLVASFVDQSLEVAERSLNEQRWVIEDYLDEPDSLFRIMYNLVRHNRMIVGAGLPFAPDYYPSKARLFQPYAVRDGAEIEVYDGIWACSSILHLPKPALADVLDKMTAALKPNGLIYTSFKYGSFEGLRNGRYFTDFTESEFQAFLKQIPQLRIEESWTTADVRPGREDEQWLNLLLRKA